MKRKTMVSIGVGAVIVVAAIVFRSALIGWFTGDSTSTGSRSAAVTTTAGPFTVEVALAPEPPRQKDNTAHVRVTADGKPVSGATLAVRYVMPAMGAMAEMRGNADLRDDGDGRYRGTFDLPMAGTWSLEIDVAADGRKGSARYSFTVDRRGLAAAPGAGGVAPKAQPPALPPIELPPPALTSLRRGLDGYEKIRALLAKDRVDGIATFARDLAEAFRAGLGGLSGSAPSEITDSVNQAASAADALAAATNLDSARREFGNVSRFVIALAASDPRLREGWHRFECSMASGFGDWLQRSPDIENPYMGTAMPTCGTSESWEPAQPGAPLSHQGHGHDGKDVSYFTCSMHPSVRQPEPGKCPICSMDLSGVTYDQQESGTIFVDESRRAVIGIKTSTVGKQPLQLAIRAVGRITYDETRLADVTLKVKGWVVRLDVNATGQAVARGQRLMTLYSPELFAAQQEYLLALRAAAGSGAPGHVTSLADASAKKLRLLGLADGQLDQIRKKGSPIEELPILSPASGYVIEKLIVEGAAVEPGQKLYRIAALDQIWVEAAIYESDLPHIKKGQTARVTLPNTAEREVVGKVAVVYPYLDAASRTGKVRIELPNKDLALKPDMYADVAIDVDLGPRLAVPVSAVVYTGPRRIVFLDIGGGQFRPQEVKLGARVDDHIEVVGGLAEGQTVVTEGNFLIAAESRIRSTSYWEDDHGTK
ncbi:MAG: FixH family protein [Deltaproteobacteria bacterium]|nr:FixH family protein [Deltaproteobacteria bacterium]